MFKIILFLSLSLSLFANYSQSFREKKIFPIAKKIYQKKCQPFTPNIHQLKKTIETQCTNLNKKQKEYLFIYLKEQQKNMTKETLTIKVHKKERCKVCGMYVHKYPKWATQIIVKNDRETKRYSFDGVKDLFKFYFAPKEYEKTFILKPTTQMKILVRDYYLQKIIDGKKAFYVLGSDIKGPMGNELIAFEREEDAKAFVKDHHGKKILSFFQLDEEEVYSLDYN